MSALLALDQHIFYIIHLHMHWSPLDPIFIALSYTGRLTFLVIAFILLLLVKSLRQRILLIAFSAVSAYSICFFLKRIFGRERPSSLPDVHPLEPLYGPTSFPSGHASVTFSVAVMIFLLCRNTQYKWVGYIAIVWSTLIAFSRVYMGVHYPLDVIAGAILGSTIAWVIYRITTPKHAAL